MTRIAALTIDQATPAAQTLLTGAKAKLGMVPNLYATLAHSETALGTYLAMPAGKTFGVVNTSDRIILMVDEAHSIGSPWTASTPQ